MGKELITFVAKLQMLVADARWISLAQIRAAVSHYIEHAAHMVIGDVAVEGPYSWVDGINQQHQLAVNHHSFDFTSRQDPSLQPLR